MKYVTTPGPHLPNAGCRHLAVRVIEQAVRDLSGAGASQADRESARGFLAGSPMLHRWCELANLDASWMVVRAAELIARSDPGSIETVIQDDSSLEEACIRERRTDRNYTDADLGRFSDDAAATETLAEMLGTTRLESATPAKRHITKAKIRSIV